MAEPLFFDCLTDAQVWSLFDTGVLHGYLVPIEVYKRLEHIAPDHGCYLFTWPADVAQPSLEDIVAGMAVSMEESLAQPYGGDPEQIRRAIAAFCVRMHTEVPLPGGRIHIIATLPRPALRAGPRLEPPARDLNAMTLAELEAYLDDMLRLDEDNADDAAASPAMG
ncbi:MAG TPA: hypothetical protein VLK82_18505 [Candidatus Tectomicrobia bacterium]|nr:hypothetical protein [Candidatus Tectomicrobia bacterium]